MPISPISRWGGFFRGIDIYDLTPTAVRSGDGAMGEFEEIALPGAVIRFIRKEDGIRLRLEHDKPERTATCQARCRSIRLVSGRS